jgi:aldehyde:ferredoxin oxidoreductase
MCLFERALSLDDDVMLWPTRLTEMMNFTAGADYTAETLMQAAERVYNLEQMFLLKAGITKADDTLPPRMLEEPLMEGPAAGQEVELGEMLPLFYRARGWDDNCVPTFEKLQESGLAQVIRP